MTTQTISHGRKIAKTDVDVQSWIVTQFQVNRIDPKGPKLHDRLIAAFREDGFAIGRHRMWKLMKAVLADPTTKKVVRRQKARQARQVSGKPTRMVDHRDARVKLLTGGLGASYHVTMSTVDEIVEPAAIKARISWNPARDESGRVIRSRPAWVGFYSANHGDDQGTRPIYTESVPGGRFKTREAAIAAFESIFAGRFNEKVVEWEEPKVPCSAAS